MLRTTLYSWDTHNNSQVKGRKQQIPQLRFVRVLVGRKELPMPGHRGGASSVIHVQAGFLNQLALAVSSKRQIVIQPTR